MVKATFLKKLATQLKKDDWVTRHEVFNNFRRHVLTPAELVRLVALLSDQDIIGGTANAVKEPGGTVIALPDGQLDGQRVLSEWLRPAPR